LWFDIDEVLVIQTMMMDNSDRVQKRETHPVLLATGVLPIVVTALLCWRTVWEETVLSLERGPQMIGFALAHGPFALLLLAPMALMVWVVVAIIVLAISLWRRRSLSKILWASLAAGLLGLGVLMLPETFWQCIFIQSFVKSPYAASFMSEAAAQGQTRTVKAYLAHGVPINARDSDGSTAANAAAVGGSVEVLELLRSRGADLNATTSFGESPLSEAIEMKRASAVAYLRAHGAKEIKPIQAPIQADVTVHTDK
jgi:Ankyrin repeats (3 copies)